MMNDLDYQVLYGYKRLALAVVLQGIRDAQTGDIEALEWLEDEGLELAEGAGVYIGPDNFSKWIEDGCQGKVSLK